MDLLSWACRGLERLLSRGWVVDGDRVVLWAGFKVSATRGRVTVTAGHGPNELSMVQS